MKNERREHLRITLSVRSAIFFPDGFLVNVPVVDFSSSGIRLEIPVDNRLLTCKEGILKIYLQPDPAFNRHPYILEIPCRLVWINNSNVGIEFLHPDDITRDTINGLLQAGDHKGNGHD